MLIFSGRSPKAIKEDQMNVALNHVARWQKYHLFTNSQIDECINMLINYQHPYHTPETKLFSFTEQMFRKTCHGKSHNLANQLIKIYYGS